MADAHIVRNASAHHLEHESMRSLERFPGAGMKNTVWIMHRWLQARSIPQPALIVTRDVNLGPKPSRLVNVVKFEYHEVCKVDFAFFFTNGVAVCIT